MNASIEKYLKAYNLLQLVSWLLAIIVLPVSLIVSFYIVAVAQLLSLLEVLHAHKKWNQSSVLYCILQIGARLMILYFSKFLLFGNFDFTENLFFTKSFLDFIIHLMFMAWCVAEVIRYVYYTAELYKEKPNKFLWWRYNAFIVCYPIGLLCELYIIFNVFFISQMLWMKILLVLILIIYAIAFPTLYLHLLKQRKIKLSNY